MPYARLDVYWPNGPIESYQLDKPNVAVGRSTGNDIVLDTTAVSRYHITLTRREGQVFLEDLESANGTYVDGQRLKAHDPRALRDGEEIQLGDIRLIFHLLGQQPDMATKPIPPETEATRRIEIVQPTYKVELEPPEQPVTPGAHVQATLTIENTGSQIERYYVEVDGVPKDWVRLDRIELELDPGTKAPVVINFRPQRRSDTRPGEYSIRVRIRAKSAPNQGVEAPMTLSVRAYSGFGIALGTPRIGPATPFEVHVHNQGSGPLPLALSGASPDADLVFDIRPATLVLGPGERKTIRGYVHPRHSALVGTPRERRFDVLARAQDASGFLTAVEGTLIEKPALPLWVATLTLPIVGLLGLIVLGVAVFFFSRPRPPVITDFSASAAEVLEGDSVVLSWKVSDASNLSIQLDDGSQVVIDPNTNQYTQVVSGVGARTFTLIARNGGEMVQREVRVMVTKPLKINAFTVTPNPVLRYVRQTVTISWNAEGAASVRFQGIEGLTGNPDTASHPASGELKVEGTPRDALDLTLIATGSDGKEVSQPVHVEVGNPTCSTTGDAQVRTGPGTVYDVLKTLPVYTAVSPDGRDASGQWIHLAPSPDPQAWIAVSSVTCGRFDPAALTLIEAVPPTPLPSTTPTSVPPTVPPASPTVTATPDIPTPTPTQPTVTALPTVPTPTNSIIVKRGTG
jgi:hypothetical protein